MPSALTSEPALLIVEKQFKAMINRLLYNSYFNWLGSDKLHISHYTTSIAIMIMFLVCVVLGRNNKKYFEENDQ